MIYRLCARWGARFVHYCASKYAVLVEPRFVSRRYAPLYRISGDAADDAKATASWSLHLCQPPVLFCSLCSMWRTACAIQCRHSLGSSFHQLHAWLTHKASATAADRSILHRGIAGKRRKVVREPCDRTPLTQGRSVRCRRSTFGS